MNYKEKLIKLSVNVIEKIHLKIFGHEIGQEMKSFIVSLFWSIFGGGLAAVVVLGINVLAGRLMGPTEYGKYSLVLIIVGYYLVPIYFGLDLATVRAIAKSKNEKEVSQNISSTAVFVLFSSIVVLSLVFLFKKYIAEIFSTDILLVEYTLLFAIFLVLKNIFDCFIRGIGQFKYQFLGRIIETSVLLIVFIYLFIILRRDTYVSYVFMISLGALVIALFYFRKLKEYLTNFNYKKLLDQLSHGKLFVLSATFTTIFLSLDKLVINRYLNTFELGLYAAYFTASVTLVTQLTQMFNNVFFPTISKNLNKAIFSKIERLVFIGFLPLLLVITLLVYILVWFFGSKYGIYPGYIIIFGLLGTIQVFQSIYYSINLTFPRKLYKNYLLYYYVINFFTIAIYATLILTRNISITSISLTLVINYILTVLMQRKLIINYFCGSVVSES